MEAEVLIVESRPDRSSPGLRTRPPQRPPPPVEKGGRPAEKSRYRGVQPRSLKILEDLGIAHELLAGGAFDLPALLNHKSRSSLLDRYLRQQEGAPFGELVDTCEEERLPVALRLPELPTELTRNALSPELRRKKRMMQPDLHYRASALSVDIGAASYTIQEGERAARGYGVRAERRNLCSNSCKHLIQRCSSWAAKCRRRSWHH